LYHQTDSEPEQDPRLNVARNMTDAVQAKIAKNKPKPTFLTEGADFSLQQKARRLDQFTWGLFYKNDVHALMRRMFRDGEVFGTGVCKVYDETEGDAPKKGEEDKRIGHIRSERVFPWELHVDPTEAVYGNPRSMFQVKL